jgi:hypothetical protein
VTTPASVEDTAAVLRKVLIEGTLRRIPRNPHHREVVLAALCLDLRRRHPYPEMELNGQLKRALDGMRARVDHVTARRYLVDCGFLKRDRAGSRYFLNYPKLESTLSEEARSSAAALVADALANHRRSPRRRPQRPITPPGSS